MGGALLCLLQALMSYQEPARTYLFASSSMICKYCERLGGCGCVSLCVCRYPAFLESLFEAGKPKFLAHPINM